MGVGKLLFWGLLIGAGVVGGFFIATGEVPTNDDAQDFLNDPSREEVDGEYIQWVELQEGGVYIGTDGVGNRDVFVTLPTGENHEVFRQSGDAFDESVVYPYEADGLPSGNYTVEVRSFGETHESFTVNLNPPDSS